MYKRQFQGIVWKFCVIDEAHQLTLYQVASVAFAVQYLLVLFDKAQRIDFQKSNNSKGKEVVLYPGDCYSWERAIFGGSQVAPWECLREQDIHHLTFSWRFGPEVCCFQRYTTKLYGENTLGIWSPKEEPHRFSSKDLARVPNTRLKFVIYFGEIYDSSSKRGVLDNRRVRFELYSKEHAKDEEDEEVASVPRVAAAKTMFNNCLLYTSPSPRD